MFFTFQVDPSGTVADFSEIPYMASECNVAEKKATCRRRSRAVARPLGSFSKILRQVATCVWKSTSGSGAS